MIEYIDILNIIKKNEGSLVTFIIDYNVCNYDFLKTLTHELKNEYKIEYDRYDIKNINVKTVVFIDVNKIPSISNQNGGRSIFFRNILGNKNVILIAIKHVNMSVTPSGLYGGEELYSSNLVFSLKNKKLTVVKSRYSDLQYTNYLDISNINKYIRKIKLEQIIKNN